MISSPAFNKEGVAIVQCANCETSYVQPLPPVELLNRIYAQYGDSYFANEEKILIDYREDRFRRELRLLRRPIHEKILLDVGCSTGSFLKLARRLGFSPVQGIDIAPKSVELTNAILGVGTAIVGDFSAGVFEANLFDIVTMWATLEHVPNPEAFIREARRVLKPGGLLLASVPNRTSFSYRQLGSRWSLVSIEHLQYFSRRSLAAMVRRCGFQPIENIAVAFNPLMFLADVSEHSERRQADTNWQIKKSNRNARWRSNTVIGMVEKLLDHVLNRFSLGDLVIMSARKGQ
jgi:ubiquinone/menaquinone biosynthesis C-methylase UbiE